MASVREARRALARGDTDEALVDLWNALEPLRLSGDVAGLEAVVATADAIVDAGDGSQAREARRLLDAVGEMLGRTGASEPDVLVGAETGSFSLGRDDLPEVVGAGIEDLEQSAESSHTTPEADEAPRRTRSGSLVWALILGAFVIINIVRGLVGE